MIQESFIREWSEMAPWSKNEMVEQDLIICRALVSIFSNDFLRENLAFRGGTALHKLFLQPQARYSEEPRPDKTGSHQAYYVSFG